MPALRQFDDWLFILTRNQAYKTLRREIRRQAFQQKLKTYFSEISSAPESRLPLQEIQNLIHDATASLPPQQQIVFKMSRIEHLSLDEIALRLQLSKNTVKSHLIKSLQGIRQYLQTHGHDAFLLVALLYF